MDDAAEPEEPLSWKLAKVGRQRRVMVMHPPAEGARRNIPADDWTHSTTAEKSEEIETIPEASLVKEEYVCHNHRTEGLVGCSPYSI